MNKVNYHLLMSSNTQGIATLLDAEKESSKIVAKARQYRVQRLKEARSEALKEIEAFKVAKEKEFQKIQSDVKIFVVFN